MLNPSPPPHPSSLSLASSQLLSDHIIELRHKLDSQNTAKKMAKSAELVLGRVVRQLQRTVRVLSKTAKRRRLNEVFAKCFHSWFLDVVRTKRAKAVLKRAFKYTNGFERGTALARFAVEVKFRLWLLNSRLIAENCRKLVRKMKKVSGVLRSEERAKKHKLELRAQAEEDKIAAMKAQEDQIEKVKSLMQLQKREFEREMAAKQHEAQEALLRQQQFEAMKLAHLEQIQKMQERLFQPAPIILNASLNIDNSSSSISPVAEQINPPLVPQTEDTFPPPRPRRISVLYSPRVVFRTWKKFSSLASKTHRCLSNIQTHRETRLMRRFLYRLKIQTEVLASTLQLTRLRSRTEATFEEIKQECQGQDIELDSLRTQLCLAAISSKIVARALVDTASSYVTLVFKNWYWNVHSSKKDKLRAASRMFFAVSQRLRFLRLTKGFTRLRFGFMFDGPQVSRAFSSRKVTIAKRSCFADWRRYVKRRKR